MPIRASVHRPEFTAAIKTKYLPMNPANGGMPAIENRKIVSAAAILLVAGLLIWFGVRPVTRALLAGPAGAIVGEASGADGGDSLGGFPQMAAMPELPEAPMLFQAEDAPDEYFEALMERREKGPQRQLQKLVDFDEEHAAAILRQWIREGANA